MINQSLKNIRKVVRLPPFRNRPDVRLYHNRIWPSLLRSRGRGHCKTKQILKRENEIVMEAKNSENSNRSRIIGLRLSPKEYEQIVKKWKSSTCRKLSDYVRRSLFEKPIVTTYRNQSLDDLMTEAIHLRNELNRIGNNFNQAVKTLHTLHQIPEFRNWIMAYESEKIALLNKIDEIKNHIRKIGEKWLQ